MTKPEQLEGNSNTARASAFTEAMKAICPLCKHGFYVTDSPRGWREEKR